MGTHGVGVFGINSKFASGSLVFYEKAVGRTATGDVLTIGTTAVNVGGTAQAVDFGWYATGGLSAVISAGGATFTITNLATTFTGADTYIGNGYGLIVGHTAQETISDGGGATDVIPEFQILGTAQADSTMAVAMFSTTNGAAPMIALVKGGNAAIGSHTTVADNEYLGRIVAFGDDATDLESAGAEIRFVVQGTPGTGVMPGSIELYTTPASSETLTLAITVNADQTTSFSGAPLPFTTNTQALGSATVMWADLFLGEAAVINFNNGNVTLTHAAGALTCTGTIGSTSAATAAISVTATQTSATPGTVRGIYSKETTFTSMTSGNLVGVRGEIVTGGNISGSYLYGVQGKITMGAHSLSTSGNMYCAVLGQMDISAGTLSSGSIACIIASVQDTTNTTRALNGIYVEFPAYGSGSMMSSVLRGFGGATTCLDFYNIIGGSFVTLSTTANSCASAFASTGTGAYSIKCTIQGVTTYIHTYDAA